MLAAGMLTAASCSDFSDYNEVPASLQPSGDQTLWENITQNPQLTQFASLLRRTGFTAQLSQPRAYTIWAPLNNTYDYSAYEQMSDSMLMARFVKNHIAEFNHLATGAISEENRIHMLNNKSYVFSGNGKYQFDGNDIVQANLPSMNGVMHLMHGAAQFYPNLYEYLAIGEDIDSLNNYFKRYEVTTLDLTESEKGPIVDGMQTYVDSVMVTTNSLLGNGGVRADIESEDSSYTFLMPNNDAYMKLYNKVKPLFNFLSKTKIQDVENLTSAGGTTASADATRNKTYKEAPALNAAYMADSLVRRIIVRNLIYSNNEGYYNEKVRKGDFDNLDELTKDTVYSTTRHKLTNAKALFDDYMVGQPVKMSNGSARIIDSIAILPWETYNPEIVVTPLRNRGNLFSANTTNVHMYGFYNPIQLMGMSYPVTEFNYLMMEPNTTSGKPDLFLKLPGVHSGTYKFYCVVLPASWGTNDERSTPMNFDLSYCDAKGALQNWHFSSNPDDKNPTLSLNTAFINDYTKVDTLELGEFTFPVNYDGLGEDYYPSLYISSPVSTSSLRKTWSREFRIYAVILKPVELVEYEEKNK